MRKCIYCGMPMEDDDLFCTRCGKEVPGERAGKTPEASDDRKDYDRDVYDPDDYDDEEVDEEYVHIVLKHEAAECVHQRQGSIQNEAVAVTLSEVESHRYRCEHQLDHKEKAHTVQYVTALDEEEEEVHRV